MGDSSFPPFLAPPSQAVVCGESCDCFQGSLKYNDDVLQADQHIFSSLTQYVFPSLSCLPPPTQSTNEVGARLVDRSDLSRTMGMMIRFHPCALVFFHCLQLKMEGQSKGTDLYGLRNIIVLLLYVLAKLRQKQTESCFINAQLGKEFALPFLL